MDDGKLLLLSDPNHHPFESCFLLFLLFDSNRVLLCSAERSEGEGERGRKKVGRCCCRKPNNSSFALFQSHCQADTMTYLNLPSTTLRSATPSISANIIRLSPSVMFPFVIRTHPYLNLYCRLWPRRRCPRRGEDDCECQACLEKCKWDESVSDQRLMEPALRTIYGRGPKS